MSEKEKNGQNMAAVDKEDIVGKGSTEADIMIEIFSEKNNTKEQFETIIDHRVYDNGEEIDVICHEQPISAGFRMDYYAPFNPSTEIIDGIRYDRDVEVPISGGRKIYIDIYRPANQLTDLPTILCWSPYGKRHWYGRKEAPGLQQAVGVPKDAYSNMQIFEGADPGFWCYQGYAVVNADSTGSGYSTGNNSYFNVQDGKNGAELVDWIGEQLWSNGRVGMFGNSALGISQWSIASCQPKHLACIAPWEGSNDHYRQKVVRGGIPSPAFEKALYGDMRGPGLFEDPAAMAEKYPLFNKYWESRTVELEKIKCPVYACTCYAHMHNMGSCEGFRRSGSRRKWFRIHSDFEWSDAVQPENRADLKLFFDRYLKNIYNGWEMTPRVRMDVTDAYNFDFRVKRPEEDFPLPRTQYTKYYLDASTNSLSLNPVEKESSITYDSVTEDVSFDYTFEEDTELSGYFKLHTWVSAEKKDADIFVTVEKLGVDGKLLCTTVLGADCYGAKGRLRCSLRAVDEEKSLEYLPYHPFNKREYLEPGEIVPLEIGIWPYFRIWHKGETLRVNIAGQDIVDPDWFSPLNYVTINEGKHTIHTGGRYDSYLLAPVIPPKYVAGDYVVR